MKDQTPRLADWFLKWFCKPSMYEDIRGDLTEYFNRRVQNEGITKARWKYFLDVLRFLKPYVIKRPPKTPIFYSPFHFMKTNFILAIRSLLRFKLISILNLLGLVTGITSLIFIALWVYNESTFDHFHAKADRIYRVPNTFESKSETFTQAISGGALGAQIPERISGVEAATRVYSIWNQVGINKTQFFVEKKVLLADPDFFKIFSFKILKGNTKNPLENTNSIVITPAMAKKYFGDKDPLNETLLLSGERPMKITAIAEQPPTNSQIQFDFIISMDLVREFWNWETMNETWIGGAFHTYLLLEEGKDPKDIEKEVNDLVWAESGAQQKEMDVKYSYFLQPIKSIHLNSDLRYDHENNGNLTNVYIFSVTGVIILMLASINYINLVAANGARRVKEIGMKKVMGALRGQIITQHLAESVVSVSIAAVLSIALIFILLPFFEILTEQQYQHLLRWNSAIIIGGGSLLLGFLAGIYPAFILSGYNPAITLKGRFRINTKGTLLRKILIITQFTITVTLVISIFVIIRQMNFISDYDLGFNHTNILYVNIENTEPLQGNFEGLRDEMLKIPGIKNVTGHNRAYPVSGLSNGITMVENNDGEMVSSSLYHMWVDNHYADTYELKILAGRFFSDDFPSDSVSAVIVNEAAVKTFGWGTAENALGKKFGPPEGTRRVVGVVNDFNFETLKKKVEPLRILPSEEPSEVSISIATNNPLQIIKNLEIVWKKFLPGQPMDIRFMDADLANQYKSEYKFRTIFAIFSTISVIIACLGLFGLVTFSAQQKIKEIGIRKVLGASTLSILTLVNKQFLVLVLAAILIAVPVTYVCMDAWLAGFAYKISFHLQDYILGAILAFGIALITLTYQSLKAALSNLCVSLKEE